MLMNSSTRSLYLKAVGELKVPWLPKHRLARGFIGAEDDQGTNRADGRVHARPQSQVRLALKL